MALNVLQITPLFPVSLVREVQWAGEVDDAFWSIFPGIVAVDWIFIVDPLKSNLCHQKHCKVPITTL